MELLEFGADQPQINVKPMALPTIKHDPISVFLSLSSLILPFIFWEDTFLAYILLLTPIYLPYRSYSLSASLVFIAFVWPGTSERNLLMRVFLIMNAIYMATTTKRNLKYRMTPIKVENIELPLLI